MLFTEHLDLRWFSRGTITSEIGHPSDILVDVISADHVHDLPGILLSVLVLELGSEGLVCVLHKRVSFDVLVLRGEGLGAGVAPSVCGVELSCVLVLAQVHTEGQLIFCELARLY